MISVFSDDSPFVVEDNRRFRPGIPTNARALNFKHTVLLPPHVARDANILDLGCCLAATGYWSTQMGCKHYLGVEHQAAYVETAQRLLSDSPAAMVIQGEVESFLAKNNERFDITCLLGILHGMYDPLALIRNAAQRTERYLCCDVTGWADHRPVMTAVPTYMPVAGQQASSYGFGWYFSPPGLQQIMDFLGFVPDTIPEFIDSYRWLCRYVRVRAGEKETASFSKVVHNWDSFDPNAYLRK